MLVFLEKLTVTSSMEALSTGGSLFAKEATGQHQCATNSSYDCFNVMEAKLPVCIFMPEVGQQHK